MLAELDFLLSITLKISLNILCLNNHIKHSHDKTDLQNRQD